MKPLLVGELNPYGSDPSFALWPAPARSAGWNLCRLLGMGPREYLARFERRNLCTETWVPKYARIAARFAVSEPPGGRVLVLLGSKVCGAFETPFRPFTDIRLEGRNGHAVILPHPSALSRLWNTPIAAERARELVLPLLAA